MADSTPLSNFLNIALSIKLGDPPTTGGDNGITASTDATDFSATQRNDALAFAYNELANRLIKLYGKDAGKMCGGLVATQTVIFSSSGTTVNKDYISPLSLLDVTTEQEFEYMALKGLIQDLNPYVDAGYAVEAGKLYAYIRGASQTVADIQITAGGTGYTSAPTVGFTGGGGTGAAATATITADAVTSIIITNVGSGYTSTPTVTFTGGVGSGAAATAIVGDGSLIVRHSNSGTLYYIKSDRKNVTTGANVAVNSTSDTSIDTTWHPFLIDYAAAWLAQNKSSGEWLEKAPIYLSQAESKFPKVGV